MSVCVGGWVGEERKNNRETEGERGGGILLCPCQLS